MKKLLYLIPAFGISRYYKKHLVPSSLIYEALLPLYNVIILSITLSITCDYLGLYI